MDMSTAPAIADTQRSFADLGSHPGFRRVFRPDTLSVGLILPLETHPHAPYPTMRDHVRMAQRAEQAGVAALWARDIPFLDPQYGDAGQIYEPLIYLAQLGAATNDITLGTTGIVLPFREPRLLAKQVNSLDTLLGGRLVVGMSSGDRPSEYPAYSIDFDTRGARFRDTFDVYRKLSETPFARFESDLYGTADGSLDMLPKPLYGRVPAIAVGQAQQSLEWIADNMDGYLGFVPEPQDLAAFSSAWRARVSASSDQRAFKPLAFGGYLYLHENRDYAFRRIRGGFAIGSRALRDFLEQSREAGVQHVALNPKVTPRDYAQILDELESDVLSHFPPNP